MHIRYNLKQRTLQLLTWPWNKLQKFGKTLSIFIFHPVGVVCVDDGWFKQPHLARNRLIGLWGWVRLHTCSTLRNQRAQDQPAITPGRDRLHGNMEHQAMYYYKPYNNLASTPPPWVLVCWAQLKSPRWRAALVIVALLLYFMLPHWLKYW